MVDIFMSRTALLHLLHDFIFYLLRHDVDLADHDALVPVEENHAVGALDAKTSTSEKALR